MSFIKIIGLFFLLVVSGCKNGNEIDIDSFKSCDDKPFLEKTDCVNSGIKSQNIKEEIDPSYYSYNIGMNKINKLDIKRSIPGFFSLSLTNDLSVAIDGGVCVHNSISFIIEEGNLYLSSEDGVKVVACFSKEKTASLIIFPESIGLSGLDQFVSKLNEEQSQ